MKEPSTSQFGIMTNDDEQTLIKTLELICRDFPKDHLIDVVELGIADGRTGFGIMNYLSSQKRHGYMFGVESNLSRKVYPGQIIHSTTTDAAGHPFVQTITLLFIDADHSLQCTLDDFKAYSPNVVPGGYIAIHDTSPLIKPFTHYQSGPTGDPDSYISCRKACMELELLQDQNPGFSLVFDTWSPVFTSFGGMVVVKKRK